MRHKAEVSISVIRKPPCFEANSPTPDSPSIAESTYKMGFREEGGGGEFGGQ
jgi:hypothetical protein